MLFKIVDNSCKCMHLMKPFTMLIVTLLQCTIVQLYHSVQLYNCTTVYNCILWCITVHCGVQLYTVVYNCTLWCTTVHCGYLCSKTRHFILQFSHPVIHYSLLIIINKNQTVVSKFNRKSVKSVILNKI